MKRYLKISIVVIIVLLVALRFVSLNTNPPGITHDENDLILSSITFWKYGKDLSGVKFPWSFITTQMESKQTGLSYILLSPFYRNVNLSLVAARFPYVIINLITGWVIYKLLKYYSKNEILALVGLLVFLINPWSFAYSRSSIEAPITFILVLSATYLLFAKKRLLLTTLLFLLSFFSYLGGMPAVFVLYSILMVLFYLQNKNFIDRKQLSVSLLLFYVATISYLLFSFKISNSSINQRSGEIPILNLDLYSSQVDKARKESVEFLLKPVVYNKFTFLVKDSASKYLGPFNIDFLFFKGDPRATYTFGTHGVLYIFDAIFLILGIYGLYRYSKKFIGVVVAFLLVGSLGSVLSNVENSYFLRSFPLQFVFIVLITYGIWFLVRTIPKKFRPIFSISIFLIYSLQFINFLSFYFYEFPVRQSENHYVSERVLVNYLARSKNKGSDVVAVVRIPRQIYQQYVFFSNGKDLLIKPSFNHGTIAYENLVVTKDCQETVDDKVVIVQNGVDCRIESRKSVLQNPKDAFYTYEIYNDELCKNINKDKWRRFNLSSDYDIEKLTDDDFCKRWVFEPL